jgi:hypothetical protein
MNLNRTKDANHTWVRSISSNGNERFTLVCDKTGAEFTYVLNDTPKIQCCGTIETWAPRVSWLARWLMPVKHYNFAVSRSLITVLPSPSWDGTVTLESGE